MSFQERQDDWPQKSRKCGTQSGRSRWGSQHWRSRVSGTVCRTYRSTGPPLWLSSETGYKHNLGWMKWVMRAWFEILILSDLQHRGIQTLGWCPAPAAALQWGSCSLSQKTAPVHNPKDRNNLKLWGKTRGQTTVFHINGWTQEGTCASWLYAS